jgi:hypothetical protein
MVRYRWQREICLGHPIGTYERNNRCYCMQLSLCERVSTFSSLQKKHCLTFFSCLSFAATMGPVSWTYPAEIYPLKVRAKAVSITSASLYIFNFALAFAVPSGLETIAWKLYCIFGVFNVACFVHVWFMFPETVGRTLEEVEDIFASEHVFSAWKIGREVGRKTLAEVKQQEKDAKVRFLRAFPGSGVIKDHCSSQCIPRPSQRWHNCTKTELCSDDEDNCSSTCSGMHSEDLENYGGRLEQKQTGFSCTAIQVIIQMFRLPYVQSRSSQQ